jgi:O-methyltransferase involved in polyketide biosynthesis
VSESSPANHVSSDGGELLPFDTSVANPARVWDYLLGGKDNFAADRAAAQSMVELMPSLPQLAWITRRFLIEVVRRLTLEMGIRQFLDVGSGLPTSDNVHDVAQKAAPESRIVYVDNDPIVMSYARALLTSTPQGSCAYVQADLRDSETIVREAARTLDFGQPVAILLLGILHYISDSEDPYAITARLMDAMPDGSFLVVGHGASDIEAEAVAEMTKTYNEHSAVPFIPRNREQVTRFFDGLEIVAPGVIPVHQWWQGDPGDAGWVSGLAGYTGYAGIGRKV